MLSCLGKDGLGEEALLCLKECGVLTDFVSQSTAKQTGQCLVTLDENAVPSYDLKRDVAYDYIDCKNVKGDFDVLYFGTLALRSNHNLESLSKLIKSQNFKEIFVDVNIRAPFYSYDSLNFCMNNATILKISVEELLTVAKLLSINAKNGYKDFAEQIRERYSNINIIVVTLYK